MNATSEFEWNEREKKNERKPSDWNISTNGKQYTDCHSKTDNKQSKQYAIATVSTRATGRIISKLQTDAKRNF